MTRLLVVSSSLGEGGAQRVTSTLLDKLDRERFAPSLCLFKPVIEFPLAADVPVEVIGGPRTQGLAELARTRPWLVGELIWRLRRHIAATAPDVVLSTIDQVGSVTATALLGARRRPRWVARLGTDPTSHPWAQRAWARWALPRADAIVVNAAGLVEPLARIHPGRVHHIANPTDFDRIDQLAAAPPVRRRDPERALVVAVGRLSWEKRIDLLIDAVGDVAAHRPVALWLVGDGPLAGEARQRIRDRGLGDTVELLGFLSNPYAVVAQADVYLLSSDVEGLPNTLIEAQALGIPAVATDCRYGPSEIIDHGETGVLVPPGDRAALAGALLELLADPARRAAMGAAARTRARARFSAPPLVRQWEQLLAPGGRPSSRDRPTHGRTGGATGRS